ncbi:MULTISPECIES: biliverdin-producing heme oxygenase [unclassified Pseudomonas]|uniref:biliverdin-producing heme oxygenase n=1 Tax=unclassified Pseudomonas TaxID=196821 RepID=UPI002AC9BE5F|nr:MULTISPECIES: biliverdin-producing heme oxygenase [unclassified Pseudomonas]MEB0048548.1 biliverdin-producing heme oxygenase [Pseudomonas sp. Dout3]MEB0099411.1 biliverdin-producing heme oxygenase [Pseudomonas sp. DC1.2]WPX57172.1 biliverdin-producing heme oxygenase [Pseudomonas sp. DC1.2]
MNAPPKSLPLILSELRTATTQQHQALEKRIPFFTADLDLYTRLIKAYYGFHRPLENLLSHVAMTVPDLDWLMRSKTPSLEADLYALGLDAAAIDAIPLCRFALQANSIAQVLGVLYVLEGATLGGQILRNRVYSRLDIDEYKGGRYFAVYGAGTVLMWRGFLACLYEVRDPVERATSVRAAETTFKAFESWLEQCGVLK